MSSLISSLLMYCHEHSVKFFHSEMLHLLKKGRMCLFLSYFLWCFPRNRFMIQGILAYFLSFLLCDFPLQISLFPYFEDSHEEESTLLQYSNYLWASKNNLDAKEFSKLMVFWPKLDHDIVEHDRHPTIDKLFLQTSC